MIEPDENVAYRTVWKTDPDGKGYIDLEPITCTDTGHIYGQVLTRGARKGFPKFGTKCICEETRYTEQMERDILRSMQEVATAGS